MRDRERKMNGDDDEVGASGELPQPLDWRFSQVFGERSAGEEVQEGRHRDSLVILYTCIYAASITSALSLPIASNPRDFKLGFNLGV